MVVKDKWSLQKGGRSDRFDCKHLPDQTHRKVNINKRYLICSNLLIKLLQQCHWRNYSVVIITFQHDISLHLGGVTVNSTC